MTTVEPKASRQDLLLALARAGLERRVRPLLDHGRSVFRRLMSHEEEMQQRQDALALLRDSFDGTDPSTLSVRDRKIYEREIIRRKKQLDVLSAKRDELLESYAEELMRSSYQHPDLAELVQSLPSA